MWGEQRFFLKSFQGLFKSKKWQDLKSYFLDSLLNLKLQDLRVFFLDSKNLVNLKWQSLKCVFLDSKHSLKLVQNKDSKKLQNLDSINSQNLRNHKIDSKDSKNEIQNLKLDSINKTQNLQKAFGCDKDSKIDLVNLKADSKNSQNLNGEFLQNKDSKNLWNLKSWKLGIKSINSKISLNLVYDKDSKKLQNLNYKLDSKDLTLKENKADFISKIQNLDSINSQNLRNHKIDSKDSINNNLVNLNHKLDSKKLQNLNHKLDSKKPQNLKKDSKKPQNLNTLILTLFLTLSFTNTAYALKESESGQRNGYVGNFILGFDYLHQANNASLFSTPNNNNALLSGVRSSIGADVGWNFYDYVKLEFNILAGFAPTRVNGNFLSGFDTNILNPNYTIKDIVYFNMNMGGKIGYNLSSITKNFSHAIFLNLGVSFNSDTYGSAVIYDVVDNVLFLEIEGSKKLPNRFRLEYAGRIGFNAGTLAITGDIGSYARNANNAFSGYSLLCSLGFSYRLGDSYNIAFFMRLNVLYRYVGGEKSSRVVTTPADNTDNGLFLAGVSSNVTYPATHLLYSGVHFGFKF
ncbi:hypothetical protein DCO58_05700 [Helicobacter saguini]|uniref:Uncharacterized protein n=1 Tax=Helicobacter saguini TaxID=1548018 RepID=A0A4U8SZM7_9HELI|nr:hypothetical protein [Helicobacter saguini]MWV67169.1 hypothetical protein [Helicobacter saguini]TLD92534.1 hypothetical protein LS64_010105 [Helicobacter saguini]